MTELVICLSKKDKNVIKSTEKYQKLNRDAHVYFGARSTAIQTQLTILENLTRIIVTAHGTAGAIGEEDDSFIDIDPPTFATILNKAKFSGEVYFDVCNGYKFGINVKKSLTTGATVFGRKGDASMDIDLDECAEC